MVESSNERATASLFQDPLSADYTLNLSNDSILLHFDSVTQRLKVNEQFSDEFRRTHLCWS